MDLLLQRAALLLGISYLSVATGQEPPRARTVDTVDEAFGLRLPDPYRWMEGESNPEFAAWLGAQGAHGRRQLDATPRLGFWRGRLDEVARGGVINRLQQPMGGRIFFLRLGQGREGVLMVRESDGRERVLLDPNARNAEPLTPGITGFSPSPDGNRVAVNVQRGGGEVTRVEVLKVADGSATGDQVDDVWGEFQVSWLPDGRGFTYTQMAPPEERNKTDPMLDQRVRLHRLGTPAAADPVLLARGTNPLVALEPSEFPFIDPSQASDHVLLIIGGARPQLRICVAPRSQALRRDAPWRCPVGYDDNVQQFAMHGKRLYLASMKEHPNGQVLALGVGANLRQAKVLVGEDESGVVTGLTSAEDAFYVRRMRGGPDEILRIPHAGGAPRAVPLPYRGAVYLLNADPRAPGTVFTLQGWTKPRTAYRTVGRSDTPVDLHLGADSPGDYSGIDADEVEVASADGTRIPLTIVHRHDARPPLGEIAILEGYGAYGISRQPAFDPFALEWVAAGHVYAVAHVRGGGEKGDRWRVAGSRHAKERGVEDFVACAEYLVKLGWSAPGRVMAWGGSAGGILVGGAIIRSPGAFGAAAIQAGELNPSRLLAAKNGANQFAELGDPRTREGLLSLAAMDPYQRIKPGTAYPAVLLIVGLNDNRVAPWASGKFGAHLQAASSSGQPVWFRTDADMGHFSTAQAAQARVSADRFSFGEAIIGK
jgi:prolyl oligopeptidase